MTLQEAGRRSLIGTAALASYWKLACEWQQVYFRRLAGRTTLWTSDPVVPRYRFTNAYQAANRVSQNLIRIQYDGSQTRDDRCCSGSSTRRRHGPGERGSRE